MYSAKTYDLRQPLSLTFVTSPDQMVGLLFLTGEIRRDDSTPSAQAATLDAKLTR
jgi:hypothetical protein